VSTMIPAAAGPSRTVFHSSSVKSAFAVISRPPSSLIAPQRQS
jgi:hypothetical protein